MQDTAVGTRASNQLMSEIFEWIASGATTLTAEDFNINGKPPIGISLEEVPEYSARFLRHVRPIETKQFGVMSSSCPIGYSPTGGITFCVVLDPVHRKFKFSYAICNEEDLFNKKTASKICNGRMDSGDYYEISMYTQETSTVENIKFALNNYLKSSSNDVTIESELPKLTKTSKRANRQELSKVVEILNQNY